MNYDKFRALLLRFYCSIDVVKVQLFSAPVPQLIVPIDMVGTNTRTE